MDQADSGMDPSTIQRAVSHQGALIGHHDQNIQRLFEANQALSQQVSLLTTQVAALLSHQVSSSASAGAPASTPPQAHEPRCTDPEPFSGQPSHCRGFLFQCSSVFRLRPASFASDSAKIHYMCGLMRGRALQWAEAKFSEDTIEQTDYEDFVREFKLVFDHPDYQADASLRLLSLSQGMRSVADYSIEFWTLAADVKWTDEALRAVFFKGLNEQLKDELTSRDEPSDLESLVSLANRIDNRLRSRRRERRSTIPHPAPRATPPPPPSPAPLSALPPGLPSPLEEPMQLGRARLTPEERHRRRLAGECLYCGEKGHFLATCPIRPKGQAHQ